MSSSTSLDFYAVSAQVIPVLVLAGAVDWPRTLSTLRTAIEDSPPAYERQAARYARLPPGVQDELHRSGLSLLQRMAGRPLGVAIQVLVVIVWVLFIGLPVLALVGEYVAVDALLQGAAPGWFGRALVRGGLLAALVYAGLPALVRAYLTARGTSSSLLRRRDELRVEIRNLDDRPPS